MEWEITRKRRRVVEEELQTNKWLEKLDFDWMGKHSLSQCSQIHQNKFTNREQEALVNNQVMPCQFFGRYILKERQTAPKI